MRLKLLKLLSQRQYLSGEAISNKLGISRTAVWKHIENLRKEGYIIDARYGRGYLLKKNTGFLTPERIKMNLETDVFGIKIFHHLEVDSTNEVLKGYAKKGYPEGTIAIAEMQTAGKGRMGRSWASSREGISFSILLRPSITPAQAPQLSLLAAVALHQTLKHIFSIKAEIKWPNDLMINGKKACGILTEIVGEIDNVNYVIVGVGINVNQSAKDFEPHLSDKAISLKIALDKEIDRIILMQAYLKKFEEFYLSYLQNGFSQVREICKSESYTLNKFVSIISDHKEIKGKAIDIAEDGALVVETDKGKVFCHGGEVLVL